MLFWMDALDPLFSKGHFSPPSKFARYIPLPLRQGLDQRLDGDLGLAERLNAEDFWRFQDQPSPPAHPDTVTLTRPVHS